MRRVLNTTIALLALAVVATAQEKQGLPERFTAFAVSTGGPRSTSGTEHVEITIERWSAPEETRRLMSVLKEKGAEAMLDVLQDLEPVGRISTPGSLAYDLHYAQQDETGDGRRIFLATDRPVPFWQAVNQPRVMNYPFTFIELRMDGDGEGEGKLALETRINVSADDKVIELVNYRAQPIQLNQVRHQG